LEKILSETKPPPKLVTVVNPGNPTGTYIPEPLLKVCLSSTLLLNISTATMILDLLHSYVD